MGFRNTREPLLVIDKNALRPPACAAAKATADSQRLNVLVIDTTFVEIVRNGKWPDHFEKDFRDWTDKPNRMCISWGVGELLRIEKELGLRAATVIDPDMTQRQQKLLPYLAAGDMRDLIAANAKVTAEAAKLKSTDGRLDAHGRTTMAKKMLDTWWAKDEKAIRAALLAEINDPNEVALLQLGSLVVSKEMGSILQMGMVGAGYAPQVASALLASPTFTAMLHFVMEAYTLMLWAQGQRLGADVNEEKQLNQLIDLDYVTYGLCCRGLFTNEKLMSRLEAGIRAACEQRWP